MIDPTAKPSVSRQAIGPGISRGSVYCKPRPVPDAVLKPMHRIDKLHMEFPFAGSRMLQGLSLQIGERLDAARSWQPRWQVAELRVSGSPCGGKGRKADREGAAQGAGRAARK